MTFIRTYPLLIVCAVSLLFAWGCGKSGMPVPRASERSFFWDHVEAVPAGNCIAFSGKLNGHSENLDSLRLELAPVNGPEDCPGCPFMPHEVILFSRKEAKLDNSGNVSFSYCPGWAEAYRWRLAGISIFNNIPNTISEEKLLIMDANPALSPRSN